MAGPRSGVELRGPQPADAAEIATLLEALGQPVSPRQMAQRLEALGRDPASALLLATDWKGSLVGLVALHWAPSLLEDRPVARISILAVLAAERRSGIGRLLVKGAAQAARQGGCDQLEWLLPQGAEDAAAFCQALGFVPAGPGYRRPLRKRNG